MKHSPTSIEGEILAYLEREQGWVFGGMIEDYIRAKFGSKASNASRRCRDLENEGLIENQKVQIEREGKKLWVVQYRFIQKQALPQKDPSMFRCWYCSKTAVSFKDNKPVCQGHTVIEPVAQGMF